MLTKKDMTTIQKDLSQYDDVREQMLSLSRTATRLAGASILEIHRGDLKSATTGIQQAERTLERIEQLTKDFSDFRGSQGVVVAFQEYVEAITLQTFAQTGKIPTLKDVRGNHRTYVLGLLDAIGEFRRMALNCLRRGDVGKAEKLLDAMEGIYDDLQTFDHTSIVPTFRVKMDAARRIIESTRGDVVTEVRRYSLEQALDRLGKRLNYISKA